MRTTKYPAFKTLKRGESTVLKGTRNRLAQAAQYYMRTTSKRFSVFAETPKTYRIERTK